MVVDYSEAGDVCPRQTFPDRRKGRPVHSHSPNSTTRFWWQGGLICPASNKKTPTGLNLEGQP